MATIMERFKEVLKPITDPPNEVTEKTTLRSLHLDTLDLVELITDLEEEFKVEFDDDEAQRFQTVGEIVRCLERKGADQ